MQLDRFNIPGVHSGSPDIIIKEFEGISMLLFVFLAKTKNLNSFLAAAPINA